MAEIIHKNWPILHSAATEKNASKLYLLDLSKVVHAWHFNECSEDISAVVLPPGIPAETLLYAVHGKSVYVALYDLPLGCEIPLLHSLFWQGAHAVRVYRNGRWHAHRPEDYLPQEQIAA